MTFVGQNLGAGKWERVKRVVTICVSLVTCVGIMEAIAARLWAPEMIGLFNSNPDVIAYGVERLLWVTAPYFVFGIADVLVGSIRGFGISVAPMVVNLLRPASSAWAGLPTSAPRTALFPLFICLGPFPGLSFLPSFQATGSTSITRWGAFKDAKGM